MGFSPQQARVALAATDTGLDVQAALDTLLSNGAGAGSRHTSPPPPARGRDHGRQREIVGSEPDDIAPPRQRIHPRRDRQREVTRADSTLSAEAQKNIQDQANELLAQASTIGLSMFNRANALWKESKEKVQKAYEERAATAGSGSSVGSRSASKDARPKWMQDAPEDAEGAWNEGPGTSGGFQDDLDNEDAPPRKPREQPRKQPAVVSKSAVQSAPAEPVSTRARVADLLSDDAPKAYVSPFRRKAPARSQVSTPAESRLSPSPAAPAPPPLIQRKCVSASSSELATSAKHKGTGTEMYKLGRYAEAETAYSYSIAALPDSHLLLVPLYNNRALTRIKTGDHSGAIDDCTTVLKLIGSGYHPAREAKVTKEDEGASVDLADAYVKALRRRAEAYEGKEKWDAAKNDWETIVATEWAGKIRNEAIRAAGRCRRMLTMNTSGSSAPSASSSTAAVKPRPKPKPKPVTSRPTPPSDALNRVREANQVAEAEDQEKHVLKDEIDARLMAWKGGKESNIRALIASLDTVLWPDLGLQKVGLHQLVSPSQVKIRYTKAIAKLHPDKVSIQHEALFIS